MEELFMAQPALDQRVDSLEYALIELAYQVRQTDQTVRRLSMEMREFKNEMKEFKNEMKDFKNEMQEFKDEMKDFKNEMQEFKDEMKDFKNEMQEFKDEMKEFKNEMRSFKTESSKKWGELANKLGTVTEDIVGPGIPSAINRAFNLEVIDLFIRRKRKMNGIVREYDTLAITDKHVFFVDVKSTYRPEYLIDFATTINDFFEFLPDLKEKHLVPVIASFFLDSSIVSSANKKGYLAIHISGDHLNFINPEVFKTYNL
jgi:FtsZ-binding cell division protein ZapB